MHACALHLLKNFDMKAFILEDMMYWPVEFRTMFSIIGKVCYAMEGKEEYDLGPLAISDEDIEAHVEEKWDAHCGAVAAIIIG